jgi:hypothetical protein
MSISFQELELKFSHMDSKIMDKTTKINNLYSNQERKLNENFNINNLIEKYSNGLNDQRETLLKQVSANLRLEMEHVNELVSINGNNPGINGLSKELRKALKFKKSPIKSFFYAFNVC